MLDFFRNYGNMCVLGWSKDLGPPRAGKYLAIFIRAIVIKKIKEK